MLRKVNMLQTTINCEVCRLNAVLDLEIFDLRAKKGIVGTYLTNCSNCGNKTSGKVVMIKGHYFLAHGGKENEKSDKR